MAILPDPSARLDDLINRPPVKCVLALLVALSVFALAGLTRLSFEDEPRNLFRQSDDDFAQMERLFTEFHAFDNDILLVVEADDLFSPEAVAALRDVTAQFRELPGVASVSSLLDARRVDRPAIPLVPYGMDSPERNRRAARDAQTHPLVAGHLLSPDGRTALVVVSMQGNSLPVAALESVVDSVRDVAVEASGRSPLAIMVTGMPVIRVDSLAKVQSEQLKFTVLALIVATGVSLALFRGVVAAAVTVAAPLVGAFWALGTMGWLGIKINGINMMLPTLVLVVGFTDAVHLVADARRSLAWGMTRRRAALDALRHLGPACALTSLTTAIGFASLVLGRTESVRDFGWACAVGTLLSFISVVTIVPLLIASPLGHFVGRARHRRAPLPHRSMRFVRSLLHYPRAKTLAGAALALLLLPMFGRLTPDVHSTEAIPLHSETIRALHVLDRQFGGSLPVFVVLRWSPDYDATSSAVLSTLRDLHTRLAEQPLLGAPTSLLNVLESLPGGTANPAESRRHLWRVPASIIDRLSRPEENQLVVMARVPDLGASALQPTFAALQRELATFGEEHPGFEARLTGTTVVAGNSLRQIIGDLARSLAVAAVLIGAVLTLVFRDVRVGLASFLPNALPLLVNAALLVLLDMPLQLTSVLTFSLCLGLAVDDTVHFVMRFQRERRRGRSVRVALGRSIFRVGAVLATTTAILAGGFGVILLSDIPALRLFAALSCLAMLTALAADLVLLPASLLWLLGGSGAKRSDSRARPTAAAPTVVRT